MMEIDLDMTVRLVNVRITKGLNDSSTKGTDHLKAAGLHLREARAEITKAQWPAWLQKYIKHPRDAVDRCLGLIEKPGEEKYAPAIGQFRPRPETRPLRLMHAADPARLRQVMLDMRRLGRPTITCVFTEEALYALEGVHRLHAASQRFLCYSVKLNCISPKTVLTLQDRQQLFDTPYFTALGVLGDMTAAEVVESLQDYAWNVEFSTRRDRVPAPGVYDHVMIYDGPNPWSLGFQKSRRDRDLFNVTSAERILANWNYHDDGNWRSSTGSRFSATVFPHAGGWKVWIGDKVQGEVSGQLVFQTAEEAKERAVWAIGEREGGRQ